MSWTTTVRASAGSRTTPSSPWWATRSNRPGARRATPSTNTSTPGCRPSARRRTSPGRSISRSSTGFPGSCRRRIRPRRRAPSRRRSRRSNGDIESEGDAESLAADGAPTGEHEGPVHRRLIRATLPRLPGAEAPVRREPEFTMRAPAHGRPGKPKNGFRGGGMHRAGGPSGQGQGQGQGNGNRAGKRHGRPGRRRCWNRSGQPGSGRPWPRRTAPGPRRQEAFAVARLRARPPR